MLYGWEGDREGARGGREGGGGREGCSINSGCLTFKVRKITQCGQIPHFTAIYTIGCLGMQATPFRRLGFF